MSFYKTVVKNWLFCYLTKMISNFNKGQLLNVKDLKDGKLYRARVMEVNKEWQSVKVHYVG